MLGTSRGGGDVSRIVDSIIQRGINQLFVLGGNGTHAGAECIYQECLKRGYDCAVVGVPKTIDNDILLVRTPPRARSRPPWHAHGRARSWIKPLASTPPWRRPSAPCAQPPSRRRAHTAAWAW